MANDPSQAQAHVERGKALDVQGDSAGAHDALRPSGRCRKAPREHWGLDSTSRARAFPGSPALPTASR